MGIAQGRDQVPLYLAQGRFKALRSLFGAEAPMFAKACSCWGKTSQEKGCQMGSQVGSLFNPRRRASGLQAHLHSTNCISLGPSKAFRLRLWEFCAWWVGYKQGCSLTCQGLEESNVAVFYSACAWNAFCQARIPVPQTE